MGSFSVEFNSTRKTQDLPSRQPYSTKFHKTHSPKPTIAFKVLTNSLKPESPTILNPVPDCGQPGRRQAESNRLPHCRSQAAFLLRPACVYNVVVWSFGLSTKSRTLCFVILPSLSCILLLVMIQECSCAMVHFAF